MTRTAVRRGSVTHWVDVPPEVAQAVRAERIARTDPYLLTLAAARARVQSADRYLSDADASIAGWRDRADGSLHYHFPLAARQSRALHLK